MLTRATYDVGKLGATLRSAIRGTVRDDAANRGLYACLLYTSDAADE